ncbi:hypothetical protein TURU_138220 [Turdus rufiventris]|nr:hypothetical protein TURU_138220 [Turdus rufiventris]
MRIAKSMEKKPYEKWMRSLGLLILEETEGRPPWVIQHLHDGKRWGKYQSFTDVTSDRTRENITKLS